MPIDKSRYPADWDAISKRIRERDGQRCKWCGVPNGKWILRNDKGEVVGQWDKCEPIDDWWMAWNEDADGDICSETDTFNAGERRPTRIVLTVAHLGAAHPDGRPGDKHDKHDVRDENLAALCQRCHLGYDMEDHIRNRRATLARRRRETEAAAGQVALFALEES